MLKDGTRAKCSENEVDEESSESVGKESTESGEELMTRPRRTEMVVKSGEEEDWKCPDEVKV